MKLICLITIFAALLFITACAPKEEICPAGGCDDGISTPPETIIPPAETPPLAETTPPPSPPQLPPTEETALPEQVKTLYDKAAAKTQSYSYQFQGAPHETEIYDVYVKGDTMKVLLPRASSEISRLNYDTVYINLGDMTAKGYCERNFNYCKEGPGINAAANDFIFKTPFDWIDEALTGTVLGSETVNGRQTLRYEYFKDNIRYAIFIDSYFGMPILIKIGEDVKGIDDDVTTYEYKSLSTNSVQEADITPKK